MGSEPLSSVSPLAAVSPRGATGEMTLTVALPLQSLVLNPQGLLLPCH